MKSFRTMLAAVGLAALLVTACAGEGDTIVQSPGAMNGINVTGTGRVTGTPDVVQLNLGVSVERPNVEEAREQAAQSQQRVIDSLRSNGVESRDIQTQQLTVQPVYDFVPGTPSAPGRQTIRGYMVSNTISAKVRKIEDASKVIDDATRAGGNDIQVHGFNLAIDDPTALQNQAREEAVAEARRQAEELADHAGVGLGKLISLTESGGPAYPFPADARSAAALETGTPIEAGELEVVVVVSAVWAID
jgi:uncharacterized protein YggE